MTSWAGEMLIWRYLVVKLHGGVIDAVRSSL